MAKVSKSNQSEHKLDDEQLDNQPMDKKNQAPSIHNIIVIFLMVIVSALLVFSFVLMVRAIVDKTTSKNAGSASTTEQTDTALLDDTADLTKAQDSTVWNLKLVNKANTLSADFAPELEEVSGAGHWFDERAADALKTMIEDCNKVEGNNLKIYSAYRSYKRQEELAASSKTATPAGQSEHQLGLAADFITQTHTAIDSGFTKTNEYNWLVENAPSYGFVLRYPEDKTDITGVEYKPWHWRYVGKDDAINMTDTGVVLEEYVDAPTANSASVSSQSTSSASNESKTT